MSEPYRDGRSAGWTLDEHLIFYIGYALPRSAVRGMRRAFTEDERRRVAKAVVEHLRLCGWKFDLTAPQRGHGRGAQGYRTGLSGAARLGSRPSQMRLPRSGVGPGVPDDERAVVFNRNMLFASNG